MMESIKKNKVLDGSNSTNAKILKLIIATNDPIICTKLIIKAKRPQKIGKLTSKNTQTSPVKIPVPKLTKNFTFMKVIRSFSIFKKVLMEVCFRFNKVTCNSFWILIDSANQSTVKKAVVRAMLIKFPKKPITEPIVLVSANCALILPFLPISAPKNDSNDAFKSPIFSSASLKNELLDDTICLLERWISTAVIARPNKIRRMTAKILRYFGTPFLPNQRINGKNKSAINMEKTKGMKIKAKLFNK